MMLPSKSHWWEITLLSLLNYERSYSNMLSLLIVAIHLAPLEAVRYRPTIIQIQETLASRTAPPIPHPCKNTKSRGTLKKEETVLLWHLWHGPLVDLNDQGSSWQTAQVWWRMHWWCSGCWGCFLVLPDLHARASQSQKFQYHLVYTFNKSLVLISTITNPHVKGIIILVYKCFNDKNSTITVYTHLIYM